MLLIRFLPSRAKSANRPGGACQVWISWLLMRRRGEVGACFALFSFGCGSNPQCPLPPQPPPTHTPQMSLYKNGPNKWGVTSNKDTMLKSDIILRPPKHRLPWTEENPTQQKCPAHFFRGNCLVQGSRLQASCLGGWLQALGAFLALQRAQPHRMRTAGPPQFPRKKRRKRGKKRGPAQFGPFWRTRSAQDYVPNLLFRTGLGRTRSRVEVPVPCPSGS